MAGLLAKRPLASWGPCQLNVDKELLLTLLKRFLPARVPYLRGLELEGTGDRLLLRVHLRVMGLRFQMEVEVCEVRLIGGFLGCRFLSLRGPLHLGTPSMILGLLFRRLPLPASWDPSDRVLLVDLRSKLPAGFELHVSDVRLQGDSLTIHIQNGSLSPVLITSEAEEESPFGV